MCLVDGLIDLNCDFQLIFEELVVAVARQLFFN